MNDMTFPLEGSAAQAQAAIAEEFAFFGDWSERYQYLIDLGRKLPAFPDDLKTEEHRLHGCQSMVWIVAESLIARKSIRCASPSPTIHTIDWHPCRRCSSVFRSSGKAGSLRPRSIRY